MELSGAAPPASAAAAASVRGASAAGAGPGAPAAAVAVGASAGSVFVKRAGDVDVVFAKVPIFHGDAIADLAERASAKFHWLVGADKVKLFLVPVESEDAVAAGEDGSEERVLALRPLSSIKALADVGVLAGSCLLAQLLEPPAAAPGGGSNAAAAAGGGGGFGGFGSKAEAAAAGGGSSDIDGGGSDGDDLAPVASPDGKAVSSVVGPIFESEARVALSQVLREVCPWFVSSSPITTRYEMALGGVTRQADLFCYCTGDSLAPCSGAPEAGVYLVWPDDSPSIVQEPALPAAAIGDGDRFSPADPSRLGPHKYFVGEVYSGTATSRRRDKVEQLETEVLFLMRRLADRSGLLISDATSVIGAAAIVFPVKKGSQRSSQVPGVLQLVRKYTGPHLKRLARAGRLLLVLLSTDQAPQSAAQRDTTTLLQHLRKEQMRQAQQVDRQLAMILQRLPPVRE